MEEISLTLNGVRVTGRPGMTILELARENGIEIPALCNLPEIKPIGSCRVCQVEVAPGRLAASCHTPIAPNMSVQTHSPLVLETRKVIVELMMASHVGFCWVCDKANFCELRKVATDLGVGIPRFRLPHRFYLMEESPYLVRDMTKCILCRRCVEACRQVKGEDFLGVSYRGFGCKITADNDQPLYKAACEGCDVCVSRCPTGALVKPEERLGRKTGTPLIIKS